MTNPYPTIPVLTDEQIAAFWSKVEIKNVEECWLWIGGKSHDYGRITLRVDGRKRQFAAHRISYFLSYGIDSGELYVLHNCPGDDNKSCVNPHHLWLGTNQDNMTDGIKKGQFPKGDQSSARRCPEKLRRGDNHPFRLHPEKAAHGDRSGARTCPDKIRRGELNGRAKLSPEDVTQIRKLRVERKFSCPSLAKQFGVSESVIERVIKYRSWKHLP